MSGARLGGRRPLLGALVVVLLVAGVAGGFEIGRQWPFERLERLRAKWTPTPLEGWTEFAHSDLPRYEMMRLVRGTSLYLFSGFYNPKLEASARVEALDLVTGVWSRKADIPQPLTHANPVVVGDTAWFVGGFEGDHPGPATSRVWCYEFATDRWSNGPSLPAPRGGGGLIARGDTLHYFGGWLPDRSTDSPDHWTFVVGDAEWRAAPALPRPRGHLSAARIDGRVYALGGALGHDPAPVDIPFVDCYEPRTMAWREAASLPFGLSHAEPATTEYDDCILMLGGRARGDGRETGDDMLLFDPKRDVWRHLGRTPKPFLGPVGVTLGDTLFAGLGSTVGAGPDNLVIWRTTLRNNWRRADPMPLSLGEVAGGIIDGKLYLVGQGPRRTLVFDLAAGVWGAPGEREDRPAAGHHHAAEVLNGKLFLFGGVGRSSPGIVQIYDPRADEWRLGPPMPFAAGSSASAVIEGQIYVAGGVVADRDVSDTAVLDPVTMQWTRLAPMPRARSEAASATDGERLFIFGGRASGDDVTASGSDDVQIYDPSTAGWRVSDGSEGAPPPLPRARRGMGKAVWIDGEFWVIGGQLEGEPSVSTGTITGRVDIFDPVANTWRVGPALNTPRHGHFPLTDAGLIYVAGGGAGVGAAMGAGASDALEIVWPS